MKCLLSSFGMGFEVVGWHSLPQRIRGIPPLTFKQSSRDFHPDLSALLFCNKVVLDEGTFGMITDEKYSEYWNWSEEYRNCFRALNKEGLVELQHFWGDMHKNADQLKQMLQKDLKHLDVWIPALRESCQVWRRFLERAARDDHLMTQLHYFKAHLDPVRGEALKEHERRDLELVEEALKYPSRLRRTTYRDAVRQELDRYLTLVNGNLVLAREYGSVICDWADHGPFYKEKFLSIGQRDAPGSREAAAVRRLFEISFPQLEPRSTSELMRILRDKRIEELRDLVRSAAAGETEFDLEFANRTLQEVLNVERRIATLRKYVSYATLPLGFLPVIGTPVQKIVEEVIVGPMERKAKKGAGWFYMLSEAMN